MHQSDQTGVFEVSLLLVSLKFIPDRPLLP